MTQSWRIILFSIIRSRPVTVDFMISACDSRSIYLKVCDASLLVNDLQMSMVDGHQNKKQKQDLDHILSIFFLNQMAIKPF